MGGCSGSKTVATASKPEVKTVVDAGATTAPPPTLLGDAAALLKGASNSQVDEFLSNLAPAVREKLKLASEPVTLNTVIQQIPQATDAELIEFLSDSNLRARLKKAGLCQVDGNALGLEAAMRAAELVSGEPKAEESKAIESNATGSSLAEGSTLKANGSKAIESTEIAMFEDTTDATNARATPVCDLGRFRCY